MKMFLKALRFGAALALLPVMCVQPSLAWGNDGHLMINRLAAMNLPMDVPAFLHMPVTVNAIEYLGPEPDRWRSTAEPELSSTQAPDHFLDMEYSDMLGVLPKKRYDYIRALDKLQASHPDLPLQPDQVGMQPWQVEEVYQRLKSSFREYRRLSAAQMDTKPVELAITFYAGWLGHYVGDGSQPLHTTKEYNGWTIVPNPNGYTTDHKIHALFETTFVSSNIKPADVAPLVAAARPKVLADEWEDYLAYLKHSNSLVEQTYQLEKAGGFVDRGTPEAKSFTVERLAAGAIELRDLIYTAWVRSADPVPEYRPAPQQPVSAPK